MVRGGPLGSRGDFTAGLTEVDAVEKKVVCS